MRAKKTNVYLKKRITTSYMAKYQCPKCRVNIEDYSFDYDKITRFKCRCGQEIVANYIKDS